MKKKNKSAFAVKVGVTQNFPCSILTMGNPDLPVLHMGRAVRCESNIRFYQRMGYKIFKREVIDDELKFVYLEKDLLP